MTPVTATRNLPGFAGSGTGSLVGRSGVLIYGPTLSGGSGTPFPVPARLPNGHDDAWADSTDLWESRGQWSRYV